MSSLVKTFFNFSNSKQKDLQISSKISKIQGLIRELQRQKHNQLQLKVKSILNAALNDQKGQSLFELVYKSATKQSHIQWVPIIDKTLDLLGPNSLFMKIVLQAQDYKVPIEKNLIPNFLFRNNILNQKSPYGSISYSISGMIVPLLDYIFIRLINSISQVSFIYNFKTSNQEYQSDDIYFYISRNPYLLLLRLYLESFSGSQKIFKKIITNIKMYFVDQILLKHRINKSISQLRDFSFLSSNYKIQPQQFLVIYLLLKKGRMYFQEKDLYINQVIQRFSSLIEKQNQIFFRLFFRIYIFAYSRNSIQNQVIDELQNANAKKGYFQLSRYSCDQFARSLSIIQARQKIEYQKTKTTFMKLLEKDQVFIQNGRIHFSTIRTLGCFLYLQILMKSNFKRDSIQESHRINSQTVSLQGAIIKIHRFIRSFVKKQKQKKFKDFSQIQSKILIQQLEQLHKLYEKAYNRKIDLKKLQDTRQDSFDRNFNVKGENRDFIYSIEAYKNQVQLSCWKQPLKDSQFQILFNLFYYVAKKMDLVIPGHSKRKQPFLNLRYFSNPWVFAFTVIIIVLICKFMF